MHSVSLADAERDPRVMRSRAAILQAAAELLIESGYGGLTIEGIAERSGVAKTTIYRHWKSRSRLILDAFESMLEGPGQWTPSGNVRGDLITILEALARGLTSSRWAPAVSALIEAGERDAEMRQLVKEFLAERMRPLGQALATAAGRGELSPDLDIEVSINLLVGPVFFRRLVSREPMEPGFAERVVDQFLRGGKGSASQPSRE
jgi:AcrR family transcriptional regulator